MRRWLDLSAYITCFHSTDFYAKRLLLTPSRMTTEALHACYSDQDLYVILKSNLNSITINSSYESNIDKEIQFGKYGECYYCCMFRKDEIKNRASMPLQKRIEVTDDYAPVIFYLELYKQEKHLIENRLILNDEFFSKFNGLEIIDITNIIIDRFQLHNNSIDSLKNLIYLSLENNDLSLIQLDFQYLNKLSYLKLTRNPFVSLPLNCLSSNSLQYVELFELGRLIEIDGNTRFSSEIKTISITESILTTLPQTLSTDARNKLTKLTLSGVSWWGIDSISVNDIVKYVSFEKKFTPVLDAQELTTIYHMYDEDANGILSFSEINLMNAHIYRYIPRLRATNTKIVRNNI
jgi:hypothetical protein